MNQIVISGYKIKDKDMRWLEAFKKERIVVYDKSNLPNVGREAHTYLHHIIKNYDNLAPVTVFAQDDIFNHIVYEKENCHKYCFHDILQLVNDNKHVDFVEYGYVRSMANMLIFEDLFKITFFSKTKQINKNSTHKKNFMCEFDKQINCFDCELVGDKKLLNFKLYPTAYPCVFGAIFAASKERIKKKPIEWYKSLIKLVEWHEHPFAAHFFERVWPYILGDQPPLHLVKIKPMQTLL